MGQRTRCRSARPAALLHTRRSHKFNVYLLSDKTGWASKLQHLALVCMRAAAEDAAAVLVDRDVQVCAPVQQ